MVPAGGQCRPELGALTGARFLAAMAVVVFHYGRDFLILAPPFAKSIQKIGYVAVPFFFLLSGFILAYNYGDRPLERLQFWRARFARIYPAYVVGMALGFPMFWTSISQAGIFSQVQEVAMRLLMVQSWFPNHLGAWNFSAWSLSAEAFFYLVFPFAVAFATRVKDRWLLPSALMCVLCSLAFPVVWLVWIKPEGVVTAVTNTYFETAILKCNPLVRLPDFLAGVFLGLFFLRGLGTRLESKPALVFGLLTAGTLLVALAVAYRRLIPWELLHNGLMLIPFGFWVVGLAVSEGAISSLLSRPRMRYLGEMSYAIYIIHMPVHELLVRLAGPFAADAKVLFPLYLLITLMISAATFQWIERPGRRWLRGTPQFRQVALTRAP